MMVYEYVVTFYFVSPDLLKYVRSVFANYLRRLPLKYKSERLTPGDTVRHSGPATKQRLGIVFHIKYQQEPIDEYKDRIEDLLICSCSIADHYADVEEISIKKIALHEFRP